MAIDEKCRYKLLLNALQFYLIIVVIYFQIYCPKTYEKGNLKFVFSWLVYYRQITTNKKSVDYLN